ncbi:MAG: UDP-N-acetylmuramoyl-L-alanine--D-glutamate ligase [Planctomycetota bacterium]|mgnify:CR=1 FL=1|nr:MAG: UDP-N-acetylmuramoyl-L-alanine--D-glutamate ligase [Planctomycetota bacterium]REK20583.1 MAG: UDP-N-acetylmuramoyl-L-alanine--D-glutamate ligase [Planctomycetota bacterium]
MAQDPGWLQEPMDYRGKSVTVMGLGNFGGGAGAARFLAARGARVRITDLKSEIELAATIEHLHDCNQLEFHLGRHDEADFTNADLIVASPAVPRGNRFLHAAARAGVPLTSEMNLFWLHNRARVTGITGTNGKSTTTALIGEMLTAAGRNPRVGGNIGRSLLPEVDQIGPDEDVVLELSSFQLEDLNRIGVSPQVAVVTGFSPNHLDRHASLEEYRTAKQTILRWQKPGDIAILNADDPDVAGWTTRGRRLLFGRSPSGDLSARLDEESIVCELAGTNAEFSFCTMNQLPGRHNRMNAAAAALAATVLGVDQNAVREGLRRFRGLPHRLQLIHEVEGRRFYDDSKATTPEAAIAAVEAFAHDQPILLLAGGSDKGIDLSRFGAAIARRVKAAALMGETAPALQREIRGSSAGDGPVMHCPTDFRAAFSWIVNQSTAGDVILLSPGCASFGWFSSFEERGEQFASLVNSLTAESLSPSPMLSNDA